MMRLAQAAIFDRAGWPLWLALVAILVLLLLLVALLDGRLSPDGYRALKPGQPPAPTLISAAAIEALRIMALAVAVAASWYLPPLPVVSPLRAFELTVASAAIIGLLAVVPLFSRSVAILRWSARAQLLAQATATLGVLAFVVALPESWLALRNLILGNLVFCGGLTLYREIRRRWRTGDRSLASQVGGVLVVAQFLSLISVAALLLPGLLLALSFGGIVQPRDLVGLMIGSFTLVLSAISLLYLVFYLVRRTMRARGFSWIDPPNWRTFWPDLKYKISLARSPSPPFFRVTMAGDLANIVRRAYIRGMVGDDVTIDAAALIAPPVRTPYSFVFTVIGDPGEGDDSQLYPLRPERWDKKEVIRGALQGRPDAATFAPDLLEALLSLPDFAIISSDVIYPAGELMDYERGVYRPYQGMSIPIYAIPGNHDWYDNLNGFFSNFVYAAAHEPDGLLRSRLAATPWNAWLPSRARWRQIRQLRQHYGLESLGGLAGRPETQQRLSFFEMVFPEAPLTVLGMDNGVIGSIDELQYAWLDRRLGRARRAGRLIVVLVGMPLYVDAAFFGERRRSESVASGYSYGMREIYELLRKHKVDVVIGGDTHAYQRYVVTYQAEDGETCTMHHFVNGGGGAYLSLPADFNWPLAWTGELKLRKQVVYQGPGRDERGRPATRYDDVTMCDIFPSAEQLLDKFGDSKTYAVPDGAGWLARRRAAFQRWYTGVALRYGFTNALDHDQNPLLQSYVTFQMSRDPRDHTLWALRIVPWFSVADDSQPEPQYDRKVEIFARSRADSPATVAGPRDSKISEAV